MPDPSPSTQRWQSKVQLPTARKKWRPATAGSSPHAVTCQHCDRHYFSGTAGGLEPATFRSLVDCWSDALPVVPHRRVFELSLTRYSDEFKILQCSLRSRSVIRDVGVCRERTLQAEFIVKISNLRDNDTSTSRTDGQTTCRSNTALFVATRGKNISVEIIYITRYSIRPN